MENNNRKFSILAFLCLGILSGFIFFKIATFVVDYFRLGGSNVFMGYSWQEVGTALSVLFGLAALLGLSLNKKVSTFTDEVIVELQKTTWPTGKETSTSTVVVSILVGISAIALFIMDYIWGVVFRFLL